MPDLVAIVDRRGALARVAAALVTPWAPAAVSQTLIGGSADQGTGPSRFSDLVPAVAPAHIDAAARASIAEARATVQADWRGRLLQGDRVLTIARDGRVEQIRYAFADGTLDRDGYVRLCFLLRDVRANRLFPMDPAVLDRMCGIQRWGEFYGKASVYRVTSGYRTVHTNLHTEGAAQNGQHPLGKAVDGFLEGIPFSQSAAMAVEFNRQGGTGVYLAKNFFHVDSGPGRRWLG